MHVDNELWGHGHGDTIYEVMGEANGFDPHRVEKAPIPAPAAPEPQVVTVVERPEGPQALTYRDRVRTGQRIENLNGDLVIIGDVNSGAELAASGHIHVYGRFAGRALAGLGGYRDAQVFCTNFQGELVSIGGLFALFEEVPDTLKSKAVIFSLKDAQELESQVV